LNIIINKLDNLKKVELRKLEKITKSYIKINANLQFLKVENNVKLEKI